MEYRASDRPLSETPPLRPVLNPISPGLQIAVPRQLHEQPRDKRPNRRIHSLLRSLLMVQRLPWPTGTRNLTDLAANHNFLVRIAHKSSKKEFTLSCLLQAKAQRASRRPAPACQTRFQKPTHPGAKALADRPPR